MRHDTPQELCIKDSSGLVVALCVGMSKEDEEKLLNENPGYHRSFIDVPK